MRSSEKNDKVKLGVSCLYKIVIYCVQASALTTELRYLFVPSTCKLLRKNYCVPRALIHHVAELSLKFVKALTVEHNFLFLEVHNREFFIEI